MPSTWRAHVIGERLEREGFRTEPEECDVYSLPPELRHRVLDAVVAEHAEFPMVLVNGSVACHSGLDLDLIVRSAKEALSDDCCC